MPSKSLILALITLNLIASHLVLSQVDEYGCPPETIAEIYQRLFSAYKGVSKEFEFMSKHGVLWLDLSAAETEDEFINNLMEAAIDDQDEEELKKFRKTFLMHSGEKKFNEFFENKYKSHCENILRTIEELGQSYKEECYVAVERELIGYSVYEPTCMIILQKFNDGQLPKKAYEKFLKKH